MSAKNTSTQTVTGTAGTTRCMTCDTPPYIAPTCSMRAGHHQRPRPDQPVDAPQPRSWQLVQRLEAGLAGRDRVAPQLALDHRLAEAAQDHDPQRRVADLRAERRGRNQLARADDRGGQHHAGADAAECREKADRRLFDRGRVERIRIARRRGGVGESGSAHGGESIRGDQESRRSGGTTHRKSACSPRDEGGVPSAEPRWGADSESSSAASAKKERVAKTHPPFRCYWDATFFSWRSGSDPSASRVALRAPRRLKAPRTGSGAAPGRCASPARRSRRRSRSCSASTAPY